MHIALFGGSFNPPGLHHLGIAMALATRFDQVLVIPCGPRPDKPVTNAVAASHRAAMVELAFAGHPKIELDLFDLYGARFSRTWQLQERYEHRGDLWHVIGADLVAGGKRGASPIQREWERGQAVWSELRFVVLARPGVVLDAGDLPPRHQLIELALQGASSGIRTLASRGASLQGLVAEPVAAYIERHGLYREPSLTTQGCKRNV